MTRFGLAVALLLSTATAYAQPHAQPIASVLPQSRSVQIGAPAAAFALIINQGNLLATRCEISPLTNGPGFTYQTTDPTTNQPTGTPNTPIDIPAFQHQSFVIVFTPTTAFNAKEIQLSFRCANAPPAPVVRGLNTLLLSSSSTPTPDVVMIAATRDSKAGSGIMQMPQGFGAFAVAAVNVGASGALYVTADTGSAHLPAAIALCQTNPVTGRCLSSPAPSVMVTSPADGTATFSVFVTSSGAIAYDPAANRVFVRVFDAIAAPGATFVAGAPRGLTSIAITTQ
jgi:hypothetical protein